MSSNGLSYGLNIKKKPAGGKPALAKKAAFNSFDDSDDDDAPKTAVEEIGELGGLSTTDARPPTGLKNKLKSTEPPSRIRKHGVSMYGDLSSSLTSKKHSESAAEQDPSIYDYDSFHDSMRVQKEKQVLPEDKERRPKYMHNLVAAAAVRKRDAAIAEEKKLAREREAEGDEFADKEKFVTAAYKRQQEENRRIEEEERRREEEDRQKNKGQGMSGFYKNLLAKGDERHALAVKAAEEVMKQGGQAAAGDDAAKEKTDADLAKEINERHEGTIAVNDEGEVVDKRQLLKGGLNVVKSKKPPPTISRDDQRSAFASRPGQGGPVGSGGGRQAMRERQTRMIESQLEQATKRALEVEADEQAKMERANKTRKTDGEISSAKERYLARKREAEEAKKKAADS